MRKHEGRNDHESKEEASGDEHLRVGRSDAEVGFHDKTAVVLDF